MNNAAPPLHSAFPNGHFDVVHYLITECNCDPMCKSSNDTTPLHEASYTGHLNVIEYLIAECNCDPLCIANNLTPLDFAIQ